jgi:hypothetical protein
MIQFLRKLKFQDREVTALQDNVTLVLNQVTKKVVIDGVQLTAISLTTGSNRINHTLGRQPLGWIVTDINAAVVPYRTAWDANTITLVATGSVTVSIWVF